MRLQVLIAALVLTGAAQAQVRSANSNIPFTYGIDAIEEVDQGGAIYTVVTIGVTNGDHFLREARFMCEAENDQGYTWDVTGTVRSLDPGASRSFRLSSEGTGDALFTGPSRVTCDVAAFDAAIH